MRPGAPGWLPGLPEETPSDLAETAAAADEAETAAADEAETSESGILLRMRLRILLRTRLRMLLRMELRRLLPGAAWKATWVLLRMIALLRDDEAETARLLWAETAVA